MKNLKFLKILFLLPAVYLFACSSPKSQSDEIILAKIDKREISVKQFLQRSDLTVRPNNFKSKNTTLINLISEKILALEAEQNDPHLLTPVLQSSLQGIKEQLMRDLLYSEVSFNNVQLDSHEIKNAYQLSKQEYEFEFYTIQNKELAQKIQTKLDSLPELADEMLNVLSNWAMEKYLSDNEEDSLNFQIMEIPSAKPAIDSNSPFFTVDSKLWTVANFRKESISHLFIFKTKNLNRNNFAERQKSFEYS